MQLYQIPFSHNCLKVRIALAAKGLAYETIDVSPMDRKPVIEATGQPFVPALVDGDTRVHDSTHILLWIEKHYPEPPLLPTDPRERVRCVNCVNWADENLMALTRRLGYWRVLDTPGRLEELFFPGPDERRRQVLGGRARRALTERFGLSESRHRRDVEEARKFASAANLMIGGQQYLMSGMLTIADIAIAAMSAPLRNDPELRDDPEVQVLLRWAEPILAVEAQR